VSILIFKAHFLRQKFGGLETDGHVLAGLENRRAVQTNCGSEQNSLTNRLHVLETV
jgi:hypothetical protein